MKTRILTLITGVYFGIVLVKTQVISWFQINDMFLFKDPYMYLVITSAIVVGMVSILILKRSQARTVTGEVIRFKEQRLHKGVVIGGTLFGVGWAITGACPGPIYAQIGAGTILTLFTFLGAMSGMYLYAYLQPRLPHGTFGKRASIGVSSGD
ncbi:MAG: YeeE/YedE family protein [Ardenticatenaceae bacterium]|nr:YeeE/YedE family protein [Ardenticatenaceae bacterium]